ncbi:hypothetical protein C0991_006634, partial [Blastosporella zonata]
MSSTLRSPGILYDDDVHTGTASQQSYDTLDSILRITIDILDDGYHEGVLLRRLRWWDTARTREWLLAKGYKLYQEMLSPFGFPSGIVFPTDARQHTSEFPYANHEPPSNPDERHSFSADTGERGIIGYAQDASGRHVVIKAILHGSEEKRILEYLQKECFPKSIDEFRNVLPVLDILPCEGHWLVITPRWGDQPLHPQFQNMKEVFHFMRCVLE